MLKDYLVEKKYYWWALAIVAVMVIVAILATNGARRSDNGKMNIKQTKVDLSAKKTPSGFPADIPVETANPVQSESTAYSDVGTTQYTYSYMTDKTPAQAYDVYKNYVTSAGYTITLASSGQQKIFATKGSDQFSVVISAQNSQTLVQLTYLQKKK